ncbi:aldehyde dehydrogenase family protein [Spelaeicoccus albus]|uniref:aldehyde dehydrogenase family protein n=2 Tax=Spelaeicoccus albus TaxID=1280376 RepID=UPI001FD080B6|nr:aldehyde dehydrogenase family protein [Spelaeicoccus albus]
MEYPAARIARNDVRPGNEHAVLNPADEHELARTAWATPGDVDAAVRVATGALKEWSGTPARQRAGALRKIAAELRADSQPLGSMIAGESGKRLAEGVGEVEFSARYFDWFAEAAIAMADGEQRVTSERRFLVNRRPVGVTAALSTWNFPLSIPARKVAAALAAGCPVVLKTSEVTPLTSYEFIKLIDGILPAGVVGYVVGDSKELSNALIDNPDVAAVSFTGSTTVGRQVGMRAAQSFTRATLELGGRAPFIVRADADVDAAVSTLMIAKFRNNGESCIAANNVFVHEAKYRQVVDEFVRRVQSMKTGDQFDEGSDLGPMISAEATTRLRRLVSAAEQEGEKVWRGADGPNQTTFLEPTVVEVRSDNEAWHQEIFGPVCAIQPYSDEASLIDDINSWGVGLAGYVCGSDTTGAAKLAENLNIGIVGINNGAPNTPEVPFGGFGDSGVGREGGLTGMFEFTEEQTVSVAH